MFEHLLFAQISKVILFIALLISNTLVFQVDARFAAAAILGSFSGAVVLAYFDKYTTFVSLILKILISAISGVFVGAFVIRYRQIEAIEYIGFVFFISSLLSLIFFRALVNFWRENSKNVIVLLFQRVFNIEPKQRRKKDNE